MTSRTPLATLTADLLAAIRLKDRTRRITDLLARYARDHQDWRTFDVCDRDCYTRNLIELNEDFELLLLCWKDGQRSPIHNHEGQDCWMAILEGPIEEAHYAFPSCAGPLEAGRVRTFAQGDVAFIRDEIGLHQVRTVGRRTAASLHVYSKPYDKCNCYCVETGNVTRVALGYHSVRGVPTPVC